MPKQENQKTVEIGFEDFKDGYVYDLMDVANSTSSFFILRNFVYLGELGKSPICISPRYGITKIVSVPLPESQECKAAYYFNGKYIGASDTKLYYWDGSSAWVLIGNLDAAPNDFKIFDDNLIICDGGVTKICDTSWNFNKLHNYYQNELIGTGDGVTTTFTLLHFPIVPNSQYIYLNSVLKTEGTDYTINDTTGVIVFSVAPATGVSITGDYLHKDAGPKSKKALVRGSRLLLTVDSDNPSHIWQSGILNPYAWNSDGVGGVPDGGFELISPKDGTEIKDFAIYFEKLYTIKNITLFCSSFGTDGKISTTADSVSGLDVKSNRSLLQLVNNLILVSRNETAMFESKIAGVSDFLSGNFVSKGKVNKLHVQFSDENNVVEYQPMENLVWIKFKNLHPILVLNSDGLWTEFTFSFPVNNFNYTKNNEFLISGGDGYIYKYDKTKYKDNEIAIKPCFYTTYSDFGSSLVNKETNQWAVLVNSDYQVDLTLKFYVDNATIKTYTNNITLNFSKFLLTEDASMLTSAATFITGISENVVNNVFDGFCFKKLMVGLTLDNYTENNIVIRGIKFITKVSI